MTHQEPAQATPVAAPLTASTEVPTARRQVLLVEDHELVREGLRLIIDAAPDLQVCADVADPGEAREIVARLRPDVALIDLSLGHGKGDGLDLVKWIAVEHPQTHAVVASMHDERIYGERALRAGAVGYVSKSAPSRAVLEALRGACEGELSFSPAVVSAALRRNAHGRSRSAVEQLSDRELQVFRALGEGQPSKAIARTLGVSVSTIDTYRERLKSKLGASGAAELTNLATRWVLEGDV